MENMFQQLERQEAEWFNDDANYKSALNDAIDFRKHSISRVVMSVLDDKRRQADNAEKYICQPKIKDVCFIHQASYDSVESMEHHTGDLAVAAFNAGKIEMTSLQSLASPASRITRCTRQSRQGLRKLRNA